MLTLVDTPATSIADFVGLWWIAQAKPSCAGRLVRELTARGTNVWRPMQSVRKIEEDSQGRAHRRLVSEPIFPGYVFVNGGDEDRYRAASSFHSASIINVKDQGRFARELLEFEKLANSGVVSHRCGPIAKGTRVRVVDGPLYGLIGDVEDVRAEKLEIVVSLFILNEHQAVSIRSDWIERL